MSYAEPDQDRREFLIKASTAMAATGAAATAVPFLASWRPTQAARLAGLPMKIDLAKIEDGEGIKILWRGIPMWIIRRSPAIMQGLEAIRPQLKDPDSLESEQPTYAKNMHRSRRDDVIVLTAVCTHLSCLPEFKTPGDALLGADLQGGLYCACHGSRYDAAGRVLKGSPAPTNLPVPQYYFENTHTLVVGADSA